MISSLNKDFKATILMVTHDSFTASYCDRILFIKDGKIQEKEYAYLHFQTKKPRVTFEIQKNLEDFEFFVNSNGFQKLENVELEKISENLEQLNQERNIFKRKQIEKFVKMSLNKKIIRIKQGIYKNI